MHIEPLGDRALIIDVGGGLDPHTLARVRDVVTRIEQARIAAVTDIVPGYTSVAVHYDPLALRHDHDRRLPSEIIRTAVDDAMRAPATMQAHESREIIIPVCYGGGHGPDLAHVAEMHGLTPDEVVVLHTGATYTVHMIGFLPGFPYLGGLDPRLATPRHDTPRAEVPAGSVGIAGEQTGVYPLRSPGGWQLIGRTPLHLFDASRETPTLLRMGDRVRFQAIAPEEFARRAAGVA